MLNLARHARDRATGGGSALLHVQIYPISAQRPIELGHLHLRGFVGVIALS
jgi:hypothetical protein